MPVQPLQGLSPTVDPFRPVGEGRNSDFTLDLPGAEAQKAVFPLARPPTAPSSPDYEGAERFPLVHVMAGDTMIAAENGAALSQVRARHPLVSGGGVGADALIGLRRQGGQDLLDAGLRVSARAGDGAVNASGALELVGSAPLGRQAGSGHLGLKAEGRLNLGDAFVGGVVEASTLPGAPVKLEANAGVATPIGAVSVHRNWNAGDERADTSLRLTNGDLRVEAGRDDRVGDTYLRVNLRARF